MVFIVIPDKENMTFRQSVLLLSVLLCPNRLSLIVNLIKILRRHSLGYGSGETQARPKLTRQMTAKYALLAT